MGNMSYCRFENTSGDLQECIDAVGEMIEGGYDLSEREERALKRMIEQAAALLELVGETIGMSSQDMCESVQWQGDTIIREFREACGEPEEADGSN